MKRLCLVSCLAACQGAASPTDPTPGGTTATGAQEGCQPAVPPADDPARDPSCPVAYVPPPAELRGCTAVESEYEDGELEYVQELRFDEEGRLIEYAYDLSDGELDFTEVYEYQDGHLVELRWTRPNGDVDKWERYEYDAEGRVTRMTDDDNDETTYSWGPCGLEREVWRSGYDGQIGDVQEHSYTPGQHTITFSFDEGEPPYKTTVVDLDPEFGRPAHEEQLGSGDPNLADFDYDDACDGRLVRIDRTHGGRTSSEWFAYDAGGREIENRDDDGQLALTEWSCP
jgi:YD repeat-containing protein